MIAAFRVVQRNALVYRRTWRGSLFFSFLQPALFLLAMGIGVGRLIEPGRAALPGQVPFLDFLAPGLLAAACMQTAGFESSFPINDRMVWRRNYEAITATPVQILDLVLGELAWVAVRLLAVAIAFTIVMRAFGVGRTPFALLAIPAAMLTGLAFSAPIMAYAALIKNANGFNLLFRFGITPLFLFSGVFFPITRLPRALQVVAWGTPLFHGAALVRGLTLNALETPGWIVHVAYLAAMTGIGIFAGTRTFARRLRA
jgi:lipooligosaccharide transport system permease protein